MVPVTYRYLTCNEIHNLLDNASYCLLGLSYNADDNSSSTRSSSSFTRSSSSSSRSSSSSSGSRDVDPRDNQPYVVPMCYSYTESDGEYTFTLYTYNEGMKWEFLESNPKICLEFNWRNPDGVKSVIAMGRAEIHHSDTCVRTGKKLKRIVLRTRNVTGRKYYNLNNLR